MESSNARDEAHQPTVEDKSSSSEERSSFSEEPSFTETGDNNTSDPHTSQQNEPSGYKTPDKKNTDPDAMESALVKSPSGHVNTAPLPPHGDRLIPGLSPEQEHHLVFTIMLQDKCYDFAFEMLKVKHPKIRIDDPRVIAKAEEVFEAQSTMFVKDKIMNPAFVGKELAPLRDEYRIMLRNRMMMGSAAKSSGFGKHYLDKSVTDSSAFLQALTLRDSPYPVKVLSESAGVGSSPSKILATRDRAFSNTSQYETEYVEVKLIASGAFGKVFMVKSRLDAQHYAIKKMLFTATGLRRLHDDSAVDDVLTEVRTLAKLLHHNIVDYKHSWVELSDGEVYLVSEHQTAEVLEKVAAHMAVVKPWKGLGPGDKAIIKAKAKKFAKEEDFEPLKPDKNDGGFSESGTGDFVSQENTASLDNESEDLDSEDNAIASDDVDDPFERDSQSMVRQKDRGRGGSIIEMDRAPSPSQGQKFAWESTRVTLFIKMAFYPIDLKKYLSAEPREPDEPQIRHCFHLEPAVGLLAAILDGVEYLHSQGVIHRDLKPANIFLRLSTDRRPYSQGCVDKMACSDCAAPTGPDEHVWIVPCIGDFGLNAHLEKYADHNPSSELAGTAGYHPVTTETNSVICEKYDVFALGVIAFELTHRFSSFSDRGISLMRMKAGELKGFNEHPMAEGIKHMIAENRHQRWGVAEVRAWLNSLQEQIEANKMGKGTSKAI